MLKGRPDSGDSRFEVKRSFPRYVLSTPVPSGLDTGRRQITGEVCKISRSGLFLATGQMPQVGARGKLQVNFPEGVFRADIVVRSVQPTRGVGVEFIEIRYHDQQVLGSFCRLLRDGGRGNARAG